MVGVAGMTVCFAQAAPCAYSSYNGLILCLDVLAYYRLDLSLGTLG